jgi:hypothetical protein
MYHSHADLFDSASPVQENSTPQKIAYIKPTPQAPALPFKYFGRWRDGDSQVILLEMNGEVLAVKQGDQLLERYQVTQITEGPQGITLTFLYQPLQQTQHLFVGKSNDE